MNKERLNYIAGLFDQATRADFRAQGELKAEVMNLRESHSTSDFPAVFQTITNKALLGEYSAIESVWKQYARPYNVNNLRKQEFYSLFPDYSNLPEQQGGKKTIEGGLPNVPELTEFPTFSYSASEASFGVAKYGARVNFSFESILNDEWGALETLPRELARLAVNTEDIVATEALVTSTGVNTDLFNLSTRITVPGSPAVVNPSLSITAIETGINAIRNRKLNGNPVTVAKFALIVPPTLEMEARRLVGLASWEETDSDGRTYNVANPIAGLVNVVVNPWLTTINTSAAAGTTWFLVPYASEGVRPAVVFSKIRGLETPELRINNATGNYLGGGVVPGREGSFLNDDVEFRVRYYVGAAGIASETVAYSLGTNVA